MSEPNKTETVRKIREIPNLPPLPALGQRILSEVNNDDVNIEHLASLIEQDPALLSRIIGIANSAYFGCPETIYTVSKAIVQVLGLSLVKSLACSIILTNQFKVLQCKHFNLNHYWFRAMMTALLAKYMQHDLGIKFGYSEDQAYLGGLLHNLGELVLVHAFPQEMDHIYAEVDIDDISALAKIQDRTVGLTYLEAGSILATKWHLPSDTCNVLQNYDSPAYRGEDWQLVNLIGLAAYVGRAVKLEEGDLRLETWVRALGISPDKLEKLREYGVIKAAEVQSLADVLSREH